jgi:hypothetical protein
MEGRGCFNPRSSSLKEGWRTSGRELMMEFRQVCWIQFAGVVVYPTAQDLFHDSFEDNFCICCVCKQNGRSNGV